MLMYNQIADIEQTKTDNDELSKMEDYSKKFEEYNGTIYGSELFSLANLQDDYTKRYKQEDGYTKITIKVIINNSISGTELFQSGASDISGILKDKNTIEEAINEIASSAEKKGFGARSLDSIIEAALSYASFEIASNPEVYSELIITPETIKDNTTYILKKKK